MERHTDRQTDMLGRNFSYGKDRPITISAVALGYVIITSQQRW